MRVVKNIVLGARNILGRFVISRGKNRAPNPWRAVVLRWRRTKKLVAAPAAGSPRSYVSLSQTQFHLHLATYLSGLQLRERFIQFAPLTTGRRAGDLTQYSGQSRAKVAPREQPARTVPRSSVSYRLNSGRPHLACVTTTPARPGHRIASAPATLIASARSAVKRPAQERLGARNKLELTPSLAGKQSTQAPMQQLAARRTPRSRNSQLAPAPASKPFRIPSLHLEPLEHRRRPLMSLTASEAASARKADLQPRTAASKIQRLAQTLAEELVWRQRVTSIAASHHDSEQEHADSTSSPSHSLRQEANLAAQVIERAKIQPLAKLDAAVLDKVTDNVIRRVEQQLRIERQRRGL